MAGTEDALRQAMVELEEEKVLRLVDERIAAGVPPLAIVEALRDGTLEVGQKFADGEYFLNELVMCGEIMGEAMEKIEPLLVGTNQEQKGTIVIGTVQGDIHDLGKNIVIMLLKGAGYNVIDLGVDVAPERFVAAAKEHGAPLVAMSALLTVSQRSMRATVEKLHEAGLKVATVIGGGYINEVVQKDVGADYFGTTADDALKIAEAVFSKVA